MCELDRMYFNGKVRQLENKLERMTDLTRYARSYLYDEGVVSDEEYAALVEDSDNGQRVKRIELQVINIDRANTLKRNLPI